METEGKGMEASARRVRWVAVAAVAAAVGLRVYLHAAGAAAVPVTSDEALTVLQAQDILRGEFPLLMSAQPYMFPLEAYWMAPLEPLLPHTAGGMRTLILLEGFVLTALGLWLLRRMGPWCEVWPGAVLTLFPSAYLLCNQAAYSSPHNVSPTILAYLAAACFAALDPPDGRPCPRRVSRQGLLAFGGAFFLGAVVTNSLSGMGLAVPIGCFALWNTAGRWRQWRAVAVRLAGMAAGGFLGLLPHLWTRWTIPHAHEAVSTMFPWREALSRLWNPTLSLVLPGTFGWQPCLWPDSIERLEGVGWLLAAVGIGAAAVFAAALWTAVARVAREGIRERRWPVVGPFEWGLGVTAAGVVLFTLNRRAMSSDFRYLLSVAFVSPFVVAGLWQRLRGKALRRTVAAAVLALAVFNAATCFRLAAAWKEPGFATRIAAVPDLAPVLETLRAQGIRHAVASHWAAYRIGFEADGDVVCAQPRNERFAGWPLPYKAEVDASDDVAYVLTDAIRFLKPGLFEGHMEEMGVEADVIPAGEFRVYCHFRMSGGGHFEPLPAGSYRVSANNAPDGASAMADGDVATYWRTDVLQEEGIAVECDFDAPVPLAGVRLRYGPFAHDRPGRLGIEVFRDGVWEPAEITRTLSEPFVWSHGHPVYSDYSTDRIEFDGRGNAEAVRISIVRPNSRMAWTLCEVEPLVAGGPSSP